MGICASNNKRMLVVRQTSSLKLKLGMPGAHGVKDTMNIVVGQQQQPNQPHQQHMNTNGVKQYDQQPKQQQEQMSNVKLHKQDSDLNLLPPELQRNMTVLSDESIFEREKRMVVLLVNSQQDKPSQLAVLDVDFQSPSFSKVIRRLKLPMPGEELYSLGCMKNSHSMLQEFEYMAEECTHFTLVAPVPSHSRIYVLKLMEASISGTNGNTKRTENTFDGTKNGGRMTEIRIQKCITREELSRFDLATFSCGPLGVCSNNAGRFSALPLLVVTMVDRYGHNKGDLFRLDRRTFCPVDRRRRSISEEEKSSGPNSPFTSLSSSPTLPSRSTVSTGSATIPVPIRFPNFGGALAVHVRHGLVFTTEWGNLDKILCQAPTLKPPKMGSQDLLENEFIEIYGNKVNLWDMRRRTIFQTIRLEPPEDGRWPICIRMVHQNELTHGFICTAIGSSIYHLHKNTKTGLFSADRVVKFSSVAVGEWSGDVPEVPAFLTDMVISMDDQHLYVCAMFHGFVAQLSISDPFRPTLIQKVFIGGIVCRSMGILHGGKTPLGKDSALRSYNTERRFFKGRPFEGGPARLQLSLDGRRLFVSNGFLRNWDEHFFPQMAKHGSLIVLVHIDPSGTNPMKLDTNIGIHFEPEEQQSAAEEQRRQRDKNGPATQQPAAAQEAASQPQLQQFYAREMRFLNGDSTADHL